MKITNLFATIAIIILFATGCTKNNLTIDEITTKYEIASISQKNEKITLWADVPELSVGYNKIYFTIGEGFAPTENKALSIKPVMDMGTMTHSSPFEQAQYDHKLKCYVAAVVFTMQSSDKGKWAVKLNYAEESLDMPLAIKPAAAQSKPISSFTDSLGNHYLMALAAPQLPKLGINNLDLFIVKRVDKDTFIPATDLTLELTTDMPSMGHGSPNNVSPVHRAAGRYQGKVNFTMSGDWQLQFKIKKDSIQISDKTTLDIVF